MRANLPIIKTASTAPTRFNVGMNLDDQTIVQLKVKGWLPFDWTPTREIIIESTYEIKRLMESNSDYKEAR